MASGHCQCSVIGQTRNESLEQIDLLFTDPEVLLDIPEAKVVQMQEREAHVATEELRMIYILTN